MRPVHISDCRGTIAPVPQGIDSYGSLAGTPHLARFLQCDTRYKIIDGIDHYGIYFDGFEESSQAALAWFAKYL